MKNRFEVSEALCLTFGGTTGANLSTVIDEATRLAWTDQVDSLSTVSTCVRDNSDVNRNQDLGALFEQPATGEAWERHYRPRRG